MSNTDDRTTITSHDQSGGITAHTVTQIASSDDTMPSVVPKEWWKSAWAKLVYLLTLLAAVAGLLDYFGLKPREGVVPNDKTTNVTSYNQSGGITAHTVNVGSPQRSLADPSMDALKAQILRDVPRTKPITVSALMGDAESYRFALEIHAFLKANSFPLTEDGISQGVYVPPPRGLAFNDRGDHADFIVGSKD